MLVLHIELRVKPGLEQVLEKMYLERFQPAISAQEGFNAVQLLHSNDHDANYRLCLTFDQQASQQKWVATDLHQEVWPAIADQCAEFSVQGYSTV
ncbi:MAG: antibiotic biosynthesis monooxygenase [Edaphobacter sp.]|nr:antibiotic biosynthesis monooxygenase [Edaphobacter sp.]